MGKSKAPAVQFYVSDFLTGTTLMTNEEVGLYIRLLCLQVENGSVPDDPDRMAQVYGPNVPKIWPAVRKKFIKADEDGMMVNEKMAAVLVDRANFRKRQSEKGILSAESRSNRGKSKKKPRSNPGSTVVEPLEGEDEGRVKSKKVELKDEAELIWPKWAGDQTKSCWNTFKEYRKASHRFTYRTPASEQAAITLLSKMYTTGEKCFDGLQECMAKGWRFPVDPNDRMVNGKGTNGTTGKTYDGWTVERIEAWMNDYKANNNGSYPNSGTPNVPKAYKLWKEWI